MQSRRSLRGCVVAALAALLTSCGTGEHSAEGMVVVEPESRSTMVVEGSVRTVLELDGRIGTLQLQLDDGDATTLDASSSYRKVFTGKMSVVFINDAADRASVHYRVTSQEGVSVVVTQAE